MVWLVDTMYCMSGSRFFVSGVGTQMISVSGLDSFVMSSVAWKRPDLTISAIVSCGNVLDRALAPIDQGHHLRVDVEPQHLGPAPAELPRQRQSHIPQTDDPDIRTSHLPVRCLTS